jgi:hypothetical protein
MAQHFFNDATVIVGVFCGEIYSLYHTLQKDEDLELFYILKERSQNKEILKHIDFSDIAEIYLFFDYDGHVPTACNVKLQNMLDFFNEETEKGKLYISYPMVESLRHLDDLSVYQNLVSKISLGKSYKGITSREGDKVFLNLTTLKIDSWKRLISANLQKANYLVNDEYCMPTTLLPSAQIFMKQKEKHIVAGDVAVLSGFPLFLFDYYGVAKISKLI